MVFIVLIAAIAVAVIVYMQQPKFGKAPRGERLERIRQSPNFRDGSFQNINPTPDLTDGANLFSVLRDFIFRRDKRGVPSDSIPAVKRDLFNLPADENILVWFGHSSYFLQLDGKKILVDPVLSGSASPLSFTTRSFKGSDVYTVDDIPPVDYLFISHDHYDHLDYPSVVRLRPKVGKVVCGLGVGAHLEYWGYPADQILEGDWNTGFDLDQGFRVTLTPARHFSGRGFKRNGSLWVSFALQTPSYRIFIGGDSGYDTHFARIGGEFGPFDLAILECGQYNKSWKYIHMMPEQVLAAAEDLKARVLMPVHWGKFSLALHAWNDPILRITACCNQKQFPVLTPLIGETVNLADTLRPNPWWLKVK